jgi:hypothetical protein
MDDWRVRRAPSGLRALSLLAAAVYSPLALAQETPRPATAPSGLTEALGVMDIDGLFPSLAELRSRIKLEVQRQVVVGVEPAEGLEALSLGLGCGAVDPACLSQIAAAVGTRYLLYGAAREEGGKLTASLTLFDARAGRALGAASGALADARDREALAALISQLLSGAPALRPVEVAPVAQEIKPIYRRPWFWGVVAGAALVGAGAAVGIPGAPKPADPGSLGAFPVPRR